MMDDESTVMPSINGLIEIRKSRARIDENLVGGN